MVYMIGAVSEKIAILSFLGPSEGPLFVVSEMFRLKGHYTMVDEPLIAGNGEVRTYTQTDRQTDGSPISTFKLKTCNFTITTLSDIHCAHVFSKDYLTTLPTSQAIWRRVV
jgi:hypothetical protein